ncbi:hypothetical protein D3C73_1374020 [compost metagenome]
MVMVQRGKLFADAVRWVERQQGAGVGDRRGVQQQRLAVERDLAQGQAKALLQQRVEQSGIGKQLGHA